MNSIFFVEAFRKLLEKCGIFLRGGLCPLIPALGHNQNVTCSCFITKDNIRLVPINKVKQGNQECLRPWLICYVTDEAPWAKKHLSVTFSHRVAHTIALCI